MQIKNFNKNWKIYQYTTKIHYLGVEGVSDYLENVKVNIYNFN